MESSKALSGVGYSAAIKYRRCCPSIRSCLLAMVSLYLSFILVLRTGFHQGNENNLYSSSGTLFAHAFVNPQGRRLLRHQRTSPTKHSQLSRSSSPSALHFFFNPPNGQASQEPQKDLPLARYVDVSANYTLVHTPEDAIDLEENQRLVCLGDVHGDLRALQQFLATAGVYDVQTDSWCGGNTICVQLGDVLDRGFQELACYQLLSKLSQQALQQNGRVILLIGNHEVLNAMGLFQYAFTDLEHEQNIGTAVDETLGRENQWRKQYVNNQPSRWASYEPGGLLAHSLMRNMKVAVKVGKTVCVHAGLKPEHLQQNGGIAGMNEAFSDWISLGDDVGLASSSATATSATRTKIQHNPIVYNHHGNYGEDPRQAWVDAEQRQKFYVNSIPRFLANGNPTGPVWMRDYSSPADQPPKDDASRTIEMTLEATLQLLEADRMAMGHTIQRRINGALGGKAWRCDVGASRGCLTGTPEVLEVVCERNPSTGELVERVSVLTSTPSPDPPGVQVPGVRIPAKERLVDSYTQAAVSMW